MEPSKRSTRPFWEQTFKSCRLRIQASGRFLLSKSAWGVRVKKSSSALGAVTWAWACSVSYTHLDVYKRQTYSNAAIAARELGGTDISVVDSRTTAGGLFLMARAARRMIDEGMTLDQVTQRLKALRDKVKVIFSVEDMGPLRRSGRLGVVRLSVSTILNIKPILKCADGSVVSCGIARGRHEQLRALERAVPEAAREMVVEHLCAGKEAEELMERVKLRGVPVLMRPVGPVLGIHLGLGCVGIAWIE